MKWKCEVEYRGKRYGLVEGVYCGKCDLYRACMSGLSRKITRFCRHDLNERPLAWREIGKGPKEGGEGKIHYTKAIN